MANRFFLLLLPLLVALALPVESAEMVKCAECGMMVDEGSRFSSRIVEANKTISFCDIGDLLMYLKEKKFDPALARVKDYKSGEWIEATKALYVHAPKHFTTPMGWSIASFRDRKEAEVFGTADDLDTMMKKLK